MSLLAFIEPTNGRSHFGPGRTKFSSPLQRRRLWRTARKPTRTCRPRSASRPSPSRGLAQQTFGYFLRQPAARKVKLTYRDVSGQMPLNLARGFLLMASTEADLVDYARAVAEAALARAAQPAGRPPLGFVLRFSVGDDGNIEAWGLERGSTAHSYAQHSGTTALWGVDRSSLADWGKRLAQHGKPDESLISLNAELVNQNERHKNLPDSSVVMFQGSRALETWARLFPDEYLGFVRVFSEKLRRDRGHLFDSGLSLTLCSALSVASIWRWPSACTTNSSRETS